MVNDSMLNKEPVNMHYYQKHDTGYFDYNIVNSSGYLHRGPFGLESDADVLALGSAHTFGRFSDVTFSSILSERYGVNTVNFGMGGKGPEFFLQDKIIAAASRFKTVIYQLPSGRCVSNSYLGGDGVMMSVIKAGMLIPNTRIAQVYSNLTDRKLCTGDEVPTNVPVRSEMAYKILKRNLTNREFRSVLLETQGNYVKHVLDFLNKLPNKKIVLIMSAKKLPSGFILCRPSQLGHFPELVTRKMVRQIGKHADASLMIISDAGLPYRIADEMLEGAWPRGASGGLSKYYPTPTLHARVAEELFGAIRGLS